MYSSVSSGRVGVTFESNIRRAGNNNKYHRKLVIHNIIVNTYIYIYIYYLTAAGRYSCCILLVNTLANIIWYPVSAPVICMYAVNDNIYHAKIIMCMCALRRGTFVSNCYGFRVQTTAIIRNVCLFFKQCK